MKAPVLRCAAGAKLWRVAREAACLQPRLYARRSAVPALGGDSLQFLLQPGHVLYVPRGFAHEAHAQAESKASSCHLTLAVEVRSLV